MKGISETIGILFLLIVLSAIIVPLATILFAQPTHQEQQIKDALPYEKIAELQYTDFKPTQVNNIQIPPAVFFIYNQSNNSADFIINYMPSIPLEIEYLMVFNGTKWIKLNIINTTQSLIAKPNSSTNYILNLTQIESIKPIKIYLPNNIHPYKDQASYIVAVTQYGNMIDAVPEAFLSKYIYEAFSISSCYPLQYAFPKYVKYYGQSDFLGYWSFGIPVLQLAGQLSNGTPTEGIILWKQNYESNESYSITIIGTYSNSCFFGGHGFDFYLFLNPDQYEWSISPFYNSSDKFLGSSDGYNIIPTGGSGGVLGFPASSEKYIIISWDPGWATYELELGGLKIPHGNGMWDAFIVNNPTGLYPQLDILSLGNGTGLWIPQPNDFIIINITYNPTTNMIYGFAFDYNTSEKSTFVMNLNNIFNPPSSGNYVFGVGSGNGWLKANWGVLYINVPYLQPLFSTSLIKIIEDYNISGIPPFS